MGLFWYSQEDEGEDDPGSQKDPDSVVELPRVLSVGSGNAETRVKEGRVGQPETTVDAES